jgi:hypothetical protein
MGLLDKLGKGLKTVSGVGALSSLKEPSSLGRVRVGAKGDIDLPAGEVELWYQVPRTTVFRDDPEGDPIIVEPGDLVITLLPAAGGDALTLNRGLGSQSSMDLKHERCKVATIEVPAAGSYSVESSSAEAPGAAELLFDA